MRGGGAERRRLDGRDVAVVAREGCEQAAVLLEKASFRYVDDSEHADGATEAETRAEAVVQAGFAAHRIQDACVCADGSSGFVDADERDARGCVREVSFEVAPGRCVVVCGRSGGGKSTVLRLVNGLAGTFFPGVLEGVTQVCGISSQRILPQQRPQMLGVVMQDPRSQFFMGRVGDEIAFSSENLGVAPAEVVQRVREAARLCGVDHLLDEGLTRLSSGQKQRVALAAAVACKPRVLVLDEPTSNLDAAGVRALVGILAELKSRGVAVVIGEHRLHQLIDVADEYLCLRAGRVAARWSAAEFARLSYQEACALGLRHPKAAKLPCARCVPEAPKAPDAGACARQVASSCAAGSEGKKASCSSPLSESAGSGAHAGWEVRNLTYVYPSTKRGIRNMSARFSFGAVTVVKGANGTGKTTLAKVLTGAVRPQGGSVLRSGVPASRSMRRRASYFVMQDADYQLYAGSVAEEVVLGRKVDAALEQRAREALAAFDLTALAHRHPASLSGGQKQRVTLAAAYCSDAELVVLDEPTSGLDGRGVAEVSTWCATLARAGKAVVVITHDDLLAALAADAVVHLDDPDVAHGAEDLCDLGVSHDAKALRNPAASHSAEAPHDPAVPYNPQSSQKQE